MTMRSAVGFAVLAGIAGGLSGCPNDSCSLESPKVQALPAACIELAGQPVSYPVQLCPTCNQTGVSCVPDLSAVNTSQDIYLDLKAQACSSAESCGGGATCQLNATTCDFTAPATPGTYHVIVYDGASGTTITHDLNVVATGSESCPAPTAVAAATSR
jgi:hypothetical protein